MKKFLLRLIVFLLLFSIMPVCFYTYLYITKKYKTFVNGYEVYTCIKISNKKSKKKKLLLGDSVARQLFKSSPDDPNLNSLACNQAISMVGHYLLFKNYLAAGNKIDTVILLMNPIFSLRNNLDQIFTFHYFLKPFYTKEYKAEFSPAVYQQIKKIPFYQVCQFPLVKASNWSPDYKSGDPKVTSFLSPISLEYLLKMKALAAKNNVTFLIYPSPLRQSLKHTIDSLSVSKLNTPGLEKEFTDYFSRVFYLDDKNFVDIPHLKDTFLKKHPNLLAQALY